MMRSAPHRELQERYNEQLHSLDELWSAATEDVHPPKKSIEQDANIVRQLFYSWVYPVLQAAADEEITLSTLPLLPIAPESSGKLGKNVSVALQRSWSARHRWDALIGMKVAHRVNKSCKGTARWIGQLQRHADSKSVFVGVEWDAPPGEADASIVVLQDGTYQNEVLFTPNQPGAACSFAVSSDIIPDAAHGPPPTPFSVIEAAHHSLRHFIWTQFLPRLIADCCILATPLVLELFIKYLMMPDGTWLRGCLIAGGICGLNLVQSLTVNMYNQASVVCGLAFRSALTAAVFEKALMISKGALSHPDLNPGKLVNLVSGDITKINEFWWSAMDVWSVPFQILVSIGLLYRLVGWIAFAAVSVLLLTIPLDTWILRKQNVYQAQLSAVMDERIRNTVEMLSGIRIVKYMGWEPRFVQFIESKRALEIDKMRDVHRCRIASSSINYATPRIIVAVTLVLYHLTGNTLTPEVIFPAISILSILRVPFMNLPTLFANISQYLVGMQRLSVFFSAPNTSCASSKQDGPSAEGVRFDHATLSIQVSSKIPPVSTDLYDTQGQERTSRWACCCACCRQAPTAPCDVFQLQPKPIIKDLTITFDSGKLTVITGPTGCGKSTLLHSILGHVEVSSGTLVSSLKRIAFVPQQPWIVGGSVRDNITFFSTSSMSADKLSTAIECCALQQDITKMSDGVDTEIGDRGASLSGGQKARIGLARAIFEHEDKDLFILDDIVSALDAVVAEHVIQQCLCHVLRDKTRIVVTHNELALTRADRVVALNHSGEVAFQGSYEAFVQYRSAQEAATPPSSVSQGPPPPPPTRAGGAEVAAMAAVQKAQRAAQHGQSAPDPLQSGESHATLARLGMAYDSEDEDDEDFGVRRRDDDVDTEMTASTSRLTLQQPTQYFLERANQLNDAQVEFLQTSQKRRGMLMSIEEKSTGSVPTSAYLRHFKACGGLCTVLFALFVFAITEAVNSGGSVWVWLWTDQSVSSLDGNNYMYVYLAFVITGFASAPARFYFAFKALRQGSLNIHNDMLRSAVIAPTSFFDTTPLGRIINRFTRDVGLFDISLQLNYLGLLQCVFFSLSSTAITIVSQPIIAVALLPCAVMYYILLVFFNRANREIRRLVNLSTTPIMNLLNEVMSGMIVIRAFHRESHFLNRALRQLDVVFAAANMQNVSNRWLCIRVELIGNLLVTSVAFAGVIGKMMAFNNHNISLLSLGLTMSLTITQMLNWIVRQLAAVEADMNCVERMLYYTDMIDHEDMPDLGKRVAELNKLERSKQIVRVPKVAAFSIELRHVSVRYRLGLPLVLSNLSCTIKAGEKVGVVGRTGSGKSTLLLALLRIVHVADGGTIYLRGVDFTTMELPDVRAQFSLIPQEPTLFEGTIRSNMDPFHQCSEALIWKALQLVGIDGRIQYDPAKLDMRVVFGGQNFSVGERQMLCLARALLKRGASCLLMDEATSNVDAAIDTRIKQTIRTAFRHHTVITVAHRLHTVADYDRILVMDGGRIAEMGTPLELLEKNGMFKSLVTALGSDEEAKVVATIRGSNAAAQHEATTEDKTLSDEDC